MKLPRRRFLHLVAGAAALPAVSRIARAQTYPTRPVHLVVGFPPGGVTDITARLIAPWLSERFGQQFVVENRPGASSNIATEAVARALPDGYTLLLISSSNAANVTLYDKLNFDFLRDIVPVASIGRDALVMVVNPSFPAKTVPEFVAYAKANPGKINMATSGSGSGSDLYGELFKAMAGIDYSQSTIAALGLRCPISWPAGFMSYSSRSRRPSVPSRPARCGRSELRAPHEGTCCQTFRHRRLCAGLRGDQLGGDRRPRDTPTQIIAILNKQVNAALADPAFKARLVDLGGEPFASWPVEFGKFIAAYTEQWSKVIRAANIKPE